MAISERERAIFYQLTRELAYERSPLGVGLRGASLRWGPLVAAIAGLGTLPAAVATGFWWVGLAGFLVAVPASMRVIERLPRPNRRWLRANGLLPRRAYVDRRSWDGTIVTRRTYILPPRLIALALALVLGPLIVLTALTQPDLVPPADRAPSQHEPIGSRPGWG